MKRVLSSIAVVGGLSASLVGCAEDPCPKLPPPTPAQLEAAEVAEVEREVGSYECVLEDGRWVWDRE